MGNIFKSDFVFLGLVIIASLLFVSGLGSSAIMGLLGYSGLSLAEVMVRTELNASRAILAQQGLGSIAIFLIPGVAMLQRWAYQQARELPVESPALDRPQWTLKQSILAWAMEASQSYCANTKSYSRSFPTVKESTFSWAAAPFCQSFIL